MTISDSALLKIKDKYGQCGSWAIWADQHQGGAPGSGMDDLSVLDFQASPSNRTLIHARYILVGLNISGVLPGDFANFHSKSNQDRRLRLTFRGTPLWGAYMTDFLKNFSNSKSRSVREELKRDPALEEPHAEKLLEEIRILDKSDSVILAMGGLTYDLVREHISPYFRCIGIPHYSWQGITDQRYRTEVHETLRKEGIL